MVIRTPQTSPRSSNYTECLMKLKSVGNPYAAALSKKKKKNHDYWLISYKTISST